MDATTFADTGYIDTTMRRTEPSPSVTESESSSEDDEGDNSNQPSGDNQSTYSEDRITPLPVRSHSQADSMDDSYHDQSRPQPARRTAPQPYNQRD